MIFEEKKIGIESIIDLLQCEIGTVKPYALMLAPVYVFMKKNERLVSVKAPLDFFTPSELEHLSHYKTFYIPNFVQSGTRFQTAAKLIHNLIASEKKNEKLSPAQFEVSNEVIMTLINLWGKEISIDPFYSAVFADELCGPIDPVKMVDARESAVVRHETGILLSGLVTFVSLHLGLFDLNRIRNIRTTIYEATVDRDESWEYPSQEWQMIARDLKKVITTETYLNETNLTKFKSEWSKKLLGRLDRIKNNSTAKKYPSLHYVQENGEAA